jgi:hypothetical protein
VNIRIERNGVFYNNLYSAKGIIDIDLGKATESTIETFRVTGTDSLGNKPIDPEYLDF